MKRNATAVWNGSGKEGKGTVSTQSGVLNEVLLIQENMVSITKIVRKQVSYYTTHRL